MPARRRPTSPLLLTLAASLILSACAPALTALQTPAPRHRPANAGAALRAPDEPLPAPQQRVLLAPAPDTAQAPATATSGRREITQLRSASSATFDLGDGRFQLIESATPLHYRDEAGAWQPINPAFDVWSDGFVNSRNSLRSFLGRDNSAAKLAAGNTALSWEPQALERSEPGRSSQMLFATSGPQRTPGVRSADGRTVRYAAGWSSADVQDQWRSGPGRSEYAMRIAQLPDTAATLPWWEAALPGAAAERTLDLRVTVRLHPGTRLLVAGAEAVLPIDTRAGISFVGADDADGTAGERITLRAPVLYEAGDPARRIVGSYALRALADNAIELRARFPWRWAASRERAFPLILDPQFQITTPTNVVCAGYNTSGVFDGYLTPQVGKFSDGACRLLAHFGLPTLPPNATISSAKVYAAPNGESLENASHLKAALLAQSLTTTSWQTGGGAPSSGTSIANGTQDMLFTAGADVQDATVWDVTALAESWRSSPSTNGGLLIKLPNEACSFDADSCGGFYFGEPPYRWTDEELQSSPPLFDDPAGRIRLVATYTGPALSEGSVLPSGLLVGGNFGLPQDSTTNVNAYHEYRLTGLQSSRWQGVAVRGLGTPNRPDEPTSGSPTARVWPIAGQMPMAQDNGTSEVAGSAHTPLLNQTGFYLMHSWLAYGTRNLRVRQPPEPKPSNAYDARLVAPQPALDASAVTNAAPSVSVLRSLSTSLPLSVWTFNLKPNSNTRIDVIVERTNIYNDSAGAGFGNFYQSYAPSFRPYMARILNTSGLLGTAETLAPLEQKTKGTPAMGSNPMKWSSAPFTPGASDTVALALAYDGPQIDVYERREIDCVGEVCAPPFKTFQAEFQVRVRVTSCDAGTIPTSNGTCQTVVCPTVSTPVASTGGVAVWSPPGAATLIGASTSVAPTALIIEDTVVSGNPVTIGSNAETYLVNCNTLASPTSPLNASAMFKVFNAELESSSSGGASLIPRATFGNARTAALFKQAWTGNNSVHFRTASTSLRIDLSTGRAIAGGQYDAQMRDDDGNTFITTFNLSWNIGASGWSGLASTASIAGTPAAPAIAGLSIGLGGAVSLDTPPAAGKDVPRPFNAIRMAGTTVTQPAELGGASKTIQAVILPEGQLIEEANPPIGCGAYNCLDLRAADDAANTTPKRHWPMPDIHTNVQANTVVMSTQGALQVYSSDHPDAARLAPLNADGSSAVSAEYSFDTYSASVSVETKPCIAGEAPSTVIEGATKISLPNIGEAGGEGQIDATFKLCKNKLRGVSMSFKSPVGIPLGSTGLFVTGLNGSAEINPDYTQIRLGIDMQASQGGDGGLLKGHGEVIIDTRGLFGFQGDGKILGTIDYTGKLWVAWSPLDIGLEASLSYGGWINGTARMHMWQGQGFANKYAWLPNDSETHIAAQWTATITIGQGDIFSWTFLDLPPDDIAITVEVAFGQFCTNGACSAYQWGIKGKLSILGYDVGLYYGFGSGFDYILGNDNHVLIDQYGGATPSPFAAAAATATAMLDPDQPVAVRQAAPAVNGVSTELFTVSADAEQLLIGLGWQTGAPTIEIQDPSGAVIVPASGAPALSGSGYVLSYTTSSASRVYGLQLSAPKPGIWKALIGNVSGAEKYKFVYLANKGAPGTPATGQGAFAAPVTAGETAPGSYTLRWTVPANTPPGATISLYYSRTTSTVYTIIPGYGAVPQPDTVFPVGVRTPIARNLKFSDGQYVWNTAGVAAGSYRIIAEVDDGVNLLPSADKLSNPDDVCALPRSEIPRQRAFDPQRFPGTSVFTSTGTVLVTDSTPPGAPGGLQLLPGDGAIFARWTPPTGANDKDVAAYIVRWGSSINGSWLAGYRETRIPASAAPQARLNGVRNGSGPGDTVSVAVRSVDINNNQSAFTPISGALPNASGGLPGMPDSVNASTPRTSSSVTLVWSAPGGSPVQYRVSYRKLFGPGAGLGATQMVTVAGNATVLSGLQTGASYEAVVTALNASGWAGPTSAPARFTVTALTDTDADTVPDDYEAAWGFSTAAVRCRPRRREQSRRVHDRQQPGAG